MRISPEAEILDAVRQSGLRIRTALRISSLHSPEFSRKTYRIEHEEGTVKARLLEDESTAATLTDFRRELPEDFARVLSRFGRVLIEEWIEGEALPEVPERRHLETAGRLLGDLHARQSCRGRSLHEMRAATDHQGAARICLQRLASHGVLAEEAALRLESVLDRSRPPTAVHGLVHLDFCGENMVVDRSGRLRVVDNERIGLDSLAYDLARTWYRWALPASAWDAFFVSYAASLPFPHPMDSFVFWKVVVAARSAELRFRALPERMGVALGCLRALAAEGQP